MHTQTLTEVTIRTGDILTPEQAADILGVHLVTVYRWIKSERLVNIVLGGRVFVLTSQVTRIQKTYKKGG